MSTYKCDVLDTSNSTINDIFFKFKYRAFSNVLEEESVRDFSKKSNNNG